MFNVIVTYFDGTCSCHSNLNFEEVHDLKRRVCSCATCFNVEEVGI